MLERAKRLAGRFGYRGGDVTADELVEVLAMRRNKRDKHASHEYGDLHWAPKGFAVEQREDENVERLPWALTGERRAEVGRGRVGHGEGNGGGCGGGEGRSYGGEMSEGTQAVHLAGDEF